MTLLLAGLLLPGAASAFSYGIHMSSGTGSMQNSYYGENTWMVLQDDDAHYRQVGASFRLGDGQDTVETRWHVGVNSFGRGGNSDEQYGLGLDTQVILAANRGARNMFWVAPLVSTAYQSGDYGSGHYFGVGAGFGLDIGLANERTLVLDLSYRSTRHYHFDDTGTFTSDDYLLRAGFMF